MDDITCGGAQTSPCGGLPSTLPAGVAGTCLSVHVHSH